MHQLAHRARCLTACVPVAAALILALTRVAAANDVEDFYRGRTLTVLISYSVGGGYDLYARLLAHYLGGTFPAIRMSCRKTCRAPAACAPPITCSPPRRKTAR